MRRYYSKYRSSEIHKKRIQSKEKQRRENYERKKEKLLCRSKRQISKRISKHFVVDEECRYLIDFLKPNQSDKSLKEKEEKIKVSGRLNDLILTINATSATTLRPFNTSYSLTGNTLSKRNTPAAIVKIFVRCNTFITHVHSWIYRTGNHLCRAIGDLRKEKKKENRV